MRFAASSIIAVIALSLAAGCASRAPAPATAPVTTTSADIASDPSWTPPNEDGFVMVEKPNAQEKIAAKKPAAPAAAALPAPNARDQQRGAVHAATN